MTKKEFKPTLTEYIGPAGAGKTTLANQEIKEIRKKGKRVLTHQYYRVHKLRLCLDLMWFPFFIVKERKQAKKIWELFKKDVKLKTKIRELIKTMFIVFKTTNLIRRARKKNIKRIIIDQGFVQQVSAMGMRGIITTKSLDKSITWWIQNKASFELERINITPETAVKRRMKRQSKIDKNKSEKEMIEESNLINHSIDVLQNKLN